VSVECGVLFHARILSQFLTSAIPSIYFSYLTKRGGCVSNNLCYNTRMKATTPDFRFRVNQRVAVRLTQQSGIVEKNRFDENGQPLVDVLVSDGGAGNPPELRHYVFREYELENW
jgi:hypothetical protein